MHVWVSLACLQAKISSFRHKFGKNLSAACQVVKGHNCTHHIIVLNEDWPFGLH